jgi:hypothetical protein
MTAFHCPVWAQVHETSASSRQFLASMRKLRRLMRNCSECALQSDCPLWEEFNRSFIAAVQTVMEEWDLG